MPGLDPGIHADLGASACSVDGRVKPGHDDEERDYHGFLAPAVAPAAPTAAVLSGAAPSNHRTSGR
jgi:hypothetical protein